jgi:hypothetical protein
MVKKGVSLVVISRECKRGIWVVEKLKNLKKTLNKMKKISKKMEWGLVKGP